MNLKGNKMFSMDFTFQKISENFKLSKVFRFPKKENKLRFSRHRQPQENFMFSFTEITEYDPKRDIFLAFLYVFGFRKSHFSCSASFCDLRTSDNILVRQLIVFYFIGMKKVLQKLLNNS